MTVQNQGFRIDLSLSESKQDDAAWDNLYNPGISKDLAILVNNLRNQSILGLNNEQFKTKINLTTNNTNNSQYGVGDGTTYKAPHFFTCTTEENDELTDSTFTNGDIVQIDRTVVFKIGTHDGTDRIAGVAGPNDSNVGTYTLSKGTNYYVCSSNARDSFKLSDKHPISGISTIAIFDIDLDATNAQINPDTNEAGGNATTYNFIRNDGVVSQNLEFFIRPDTLDDEFSYLGSESINSTFNSNLNAYEYSEILILKKYKNNESIKTDRDIKFEGSVRVKDPNDYNANDTNHPLKKSTNDKWNNTPDAPGVFIGDTRAFSTDNNPWAKNDDMFSTESHADEFTIGDLEFGGVIDPSDNSITDGKIKIDGLELVNANSETELIDITGNELTGSNLGVYLNGNNVYKFPMIINGETFFVLVQRE